MWMCDRCQSINDDNQNLCTRCGAAPLTVGERPPPTPPEPPSEVFVPQFGRPVTGSDAAASAPPAAPPVDTSGLATPPAAPYVSAPSPGEQAGTNLAVGLGIGVLILMFLGRLLNPVRLLFVAIGVGVIFLGHYLGHRTETFRKTAIQATGRVVRLDQSGSGGDAYYYSVVDFVTRDGAPTEFRDTQGARPPDHHVGDTVTVYYNPLAPTDAQVDSSVSRWLPIGMYVFGALMIFGALAGSVARQSADMDIAASL